MTDALSGWIGHGREISDLCALPLVRRVALLLDHDEASLRDGDALPQGWHVCLFTPRIPQADLREDGHASTDPLMPPAPLPRRVLGGRRCQFLGALPIGASVKRVDKILDISRKQGRSGEMVLITTRHTVSLEGDDQPVLIEEQDSIYRQAPTPGAPAAAPRPAKQMPAPQFSRRIAPDTAMLFRYSAITFNTHRIHYDLPYVTEREGYPGLVVNGGLMTLLLMDLLWRQTGQRVSSTEAQNYSMAHGGTALTLCGAPQDAGWLLWAEDADTGRLIMEIRAR